MPARRTSAAVRAVVAGVTALLLGGWARAQHVATTAHTARSAAPTREAIAAFVDGVVQEAMTSRHIAGVTVAVVLDGDVVLLRGYGVADLDPLRPVDPERTTFKVGSTSKVLTWTLLMQLVERGDVQLDAPVNRYLPASVKLPDDRVFEPIRIRDLMAHTTGFEDRWLGFIVHRDAATIPDPSDYLREHVPQRVRAPGLFSTYSNYGANLAGALIAQVAGADFPSVAERAVFAPLGMRHSSFREAYVARSDLPAPLSAAEAALQTRAFLWAGSRFVAAPPEHFAMAAPAGGMTTTAADMARLMLAQLRGGELGGQRIYGERTAEAFRHALLATPSGVNGWAHGLMVLQMPGGHVGYGHPGASLFQNAGLVIVPALDLGVFVATNTPTGGGLTESLPKSIVRQFYATPVRPRAPVPSLDAEAWRYDGRYVSTRRPYSGLELFESLNSDVVATVSVTGGVLLVSIGGAVQSWVPNGPPGHFVSMLGDDSLDFSLDARGRARYFPTPRGTARMERAGVALDPRYFERAAAVAAAAALVLGGIALWRLRFRSREPRPGTATSADVVALATAGVALAAFLTVAHWVATIDEIVLAYDFPDRELQCGSLLSLVATGMLALLAVMLVAGWRKGDRRAALLYAPGLGVLLAFAVLVGYHGLLLPWR